MNSAVILHPQTKLKTEIFLKRPSHALLLSGPSGSGKGHLAKWIASQMGYQVYQLTPADDKKTITIEQIRDLYNLTRTGSALYILIESAENMSHEAQNAFLKLLEEPPRQVTFVLTVENPQKILTTIRSRMQQIRVLPPLKNELFAHASESFSTNPSELQTLGFTSHGLPGYLLQILEDEEAKKTHLASVSEAKQFYAATPYERHKICLEHSYDKEWITDLLDILSLIVTTLLKNASSTAIVKLKHQAELIEETAVRCLQQNGNPKIHIARLASLL